MNRRSFLGRAGVAVVAAPAMARQVEDAAVNAATPSIPTQLEGDYSEPAALRKAINQNSDARRLLRKQISQEYRDKQRITDIRQRSRLSMRSWSPCFTTMVMSDDAAELDAKTRSLWEEMAKLTGLTDLMGDEE